MSDKSLFFQLAETYERHRLARRAAGEEPKPRPLAHFLRWLVPNGGTLLVVLVLVLTQQVWARPVPQQVNVPGPSATTVNYQGRLADPAGNPLDGTYGMSFSLWDASAGGALVWGPENHPAVPVSGGLFSVGLGSQTSGGIPTTVWNGDRYLEMIVGGETLSPRELIRSVPIAGMALTVPDGAITTDKVADGAITTAKIAERAVTDSWYLAPTSAVMNNAALDVWTDIADTSFTFYLTSDARVFLTYSINVQPMTAPGISYLSTRLVVDGIPYSSSGDHYQPYSLGDSNVNLNGNLILDLGAGSHTVGLQWLRAVDIAVTWKTDPAAGGAGARTISVLAFYR